MSENHTLYNSYTQTELHALFSSSTWGNLSFNEKLNACQEVENRYAAEYDTIPCTSTYAPMSGACYGYQNGNTICLNESMLRDGVFHTQITDENGNTIDYITPVSAPSWNTLDTVYHEGTHGIQESQGRIPSTYLDPDSDYDLYRIQGIEKEAYTAGQQRTLSALQETEIKNGQPDVSRNDYLDSIQNDSFYHALQSAAAHYEDPDIENTLAQVISDRENNITPQNPSPSYQAINSLCDSYEIHSSKDLQESLSPPSEPYIPNGTYASSDTHSILDGSNLLSESDSFSEIDSISSDGSSLSDDNNTFINFSLSSLEDGSNLSEDMSSNLYAEGTYDDGSTQSTSTVNDTSITDDTNDYDSDDGMDF